MALFVTSFVISALRHHSGAIRSGPLPDIILYVTPRHSIRAGGRSGSKATAEIFSAFVSIVGGRGGMAFEIFKLCLFSLIILAVI